MLLGRHLAGLHFLLVLLGILEGVGHNPLVELYFVHTPSSQADGCVEHKDFHHGQEFDESEVFLALDVGFFRALFESSEFGPPVFGASGNYGESEPQNHESRLRQLVKPQPLLVLFIGLLEDAVKPIVKAQVRGRWPDYNVEDGVHHLGPLEELAIRGRHLENVVE